MSRELSVQTMIRWYRYAGLSLSTLVVAWVKSVTAISGTGQNYRSLTTYIKMFDIVVLVDLL
jgi:hypothetical protein